MKKAVLALVSFTLLPAVVQAVYAPIPAIEQQNPFTVTLQGGVGYDTNVLATPSPTEVESAYFMVNPTVKFNGHIFESEQTLIGLSYSPEFYQYSDRGPGADDSLLNHRLMASVDHAFSEQVRLRADDQYSYIQNPSSALTGLAFLDQGYTLNVFNTRLSYDIDTRHAVVAKYRNTIYDYKKGLSAGLDRTEQLAGLEYRYKNTSESAIVGEYRFQSVNYRNSVTSTTADSTSNFFLVGYDHNVNSKLSYQSRAGVEVRDHKNNGDSSNPYVELTAAYEYGTGSVLSGGVYMRTSESNNVGTYTNQESTGLFVNLTHAFTGTLVGSAHVAYDFAVLEEKALADIDEETLRAGLGLTWSFAERWDAIVSYDYDDVSSDSAPREYDRHRVLLSTRYTFGFGR